jgi:hypothetical protein
MVRNSELTEAVEVFPQLQKDVENLRDMQVPLAARRASSKRILAAITGTIRGHEEVAKKAFEAKGKLEDVRAQLSKIQSQVESLGGPYSITSEGRMPLNASGDTTTGLVKLWQQKEELTEKAGKIEKLLSEWIGKHSADGRAMKVLLEYLDLLYPDAPITRQPEGVNTVWPPGTYQGSGVVQDVPQFMGQPDPDGMLQATYDAILAAWKNMKDRLGLNDYLR